MQEDLDPLSTLDEATRRRLYEFVVDSGDPVTRDEAVEATGIDRSLVAYHLDKLADAGLVAVSFARPEGRGGPGAGRPAKHYERASREFSVTVPPRDYRLAGHILARAVERDPTGAVRDALDDAAHEIGRELVETQPSTATELLSYLRDQGFEPYIDDDVVRLRNCPFHQLAQEHTELICGMNLAMLSAVVDADDGAYTAVLDPSPGRCCVAFEKT